MKANINDNPIRIKAIPNRYKRPNGTTIDGYKLRTDLHDEDGWRDVIVPTYDTTTQKIGELIVLNDTVTYEVINKTQQEIDDEAESGLENEADDKMREHIDKGKKLHNKCYRKIWRKVVKNETLTKQKGRKLFRWLAPVWTRLILGDFRQASKDIEDVLIDNDVELQTEPLMLEVLLWFEELINDYKNNKYDL